MTTNNGYWERFWRRRLSRRRMLQGAALGGAGLAAAAVIGCAEEEKPAASPAPGVTPSPAVKTVRGGTLNTNETADPSNLDPYLIPWATNYDFDSAIYSRLWMHTEEKRGGMKGAEHAKLIVYPDLAISEEVSQDLMTYTYKLRPGTKWQNVLPLNGRPLTAEDIRLSAERFMDPKTNPPQYVRFTENVKTVETPDAQTVVFKLKGPNAWWTGFLAHNNYFYITPAKEQLEGLDIKKTPAGSGPWIFDKWDESVAMNFRRNPDYYTKSLYDGQPVPYADKLDWRFIRDPAALMADFRAGKLDILTANASPFIGRRDWESLGQARQGVQLDAMPQIGLIGIAFQSAFATFESRTQPPVKPYDPNSPFNDVRVRQAVSMAIDREAMLRVMDAEGLWKPATDGWHNFVTSAFRDYWLNPVGPEMAAKGLDKWFKYNVAEAKKLMEAAGFGKGTPEVIFHGGTTISGAGVGKARWEAESSMLKAIGINHRQEVEDTASVFVVRTWRGNFQGMVSWQTSGKGQLWSFLRDTFSKGGYGHHGIDDAEVENFINKIGAAGKKEEQVQLARDFQFYMADKMYMVPTVNAPDYTAAQPWVKNWHVEVWFDDLGETYPYAWLEGKPT